MNQNYRRQGFGNGIDTMLNEIFNEFPKTMNKVREESLFHPRVNISENENAYNVALRVPGYEKTDFSIKLEDKLLTVSAEVKKEETSSDMKSIRNEFSVRSFKRSFTLDEKIDEQNISAKYENGILKITLNKKENVQNVQDIKID